MRRSPIRIHGAPWCLCFRKGVTTGGNSTFGAAVRYMLNCAGFKNITLHWLHAKNSVSYREPFFRMTATL